MKKYFLYFLSIFCSSCLISRMQSPKLIGRILDYENNPIENCQVGKVFTDNNGYFSIPEVRYLSFEILPFEAPAAFVSEEIKKEGYETDLITMFSAFGGASPKGTTWDTKNIYLKRINENINIQKLISDTKWTTIYTKKDTNLIGLLSFYMDHRPVTRKINERESLFHYRMREEYPVIENFSPFVEITFKNDSVYISDQTKKYTNDSICKGKYHFVSDSIIQLDTNHPKIKGKYRFEEFDKVFFNLKAIENNK